MPMFERVFQWTVRYGSRLLFAVAAMMVLLGAAATVVRFANTAAQVAAGRAAYDLPYGYLLMLLGGLLSAVKEAVVPLVAAIVLDRFDRWIIHRQV
jgi:uncharacterized membrane protein